MRDWRGELVASKSAGEALLMRHMLQGGLHPVALHDKGVLNDDGTALYYYDQIDRPENRILDITYGVNKRHCTIALKTFHVGKDYRGKGFGLMGVKAVLGIVHALGMNTLNIFWPREDGPSFWSSLGALPMDVEQISSLGDTIRLNLTQHRRKLTQNDSNTLRTIASIADKNPIRGWRLLSQTDICFGANQKSFKALVFAEYENIAMAFLLGDKSTQAILKQRLGVIPPFAPHRRGYHPALSELNIR